MNASRRALFIAFARSAVLLAVLLWLAAGCSPEMPAQVSKQVVRLFPSIVEPTRTPFQPVPPTPTVTVTPTLTPEPVRELIVWLDPGIPEPLRSSLQLPADARQAPSPDEANLVVGPLRGGNEMQVSWVYALVAPFPTITDDVSLDALQRAWRGELDGGFGSRLLMTESTRAAFQARWGPHGDKLVIMPEDQLVDYAWQNRDLLAIIPFEQIEPRWKVLRVDGLSPLDRDPGQGEYPLTIWFGVTGTTEGLQLLAAHLQASGRSSAEFFPAGNRDPSKMTTLFMTGVTALARATGYKMDTLGATYPGRDIADLLRSADLTHISNEVSFNPDCPKANFFDTSTMFCSRPEYIELLDFIGTDIVELSGNHNNDHSRAASSFSLDLYRQRGWYTFGGGANLSEAREPARIEHNGNRIAFLGCNPVGPPGAWAGENQPGAAPCGNMAWMLDSIRALRAEGYLPVVTFQYFELYVYYPSDSQRRDFRAAVDAGAVIVSGSQAHFPQIMEFYDNRFIHYGLGNLFFDQMDVPVQGTRREFIDRHYFYDGRHIQTELHTLLLEDYARPRPMDESERRQFLTDIFTAAGW